MKHWPEHIRDIRRDNLLKIGLDEVLATQFAWSTISMFGPIDLNQPYYGPRICERDRTHICNSIELQLDREGKILKGRLKKLDARWADMQAKDQRKRAEQNKRQKAATAKPLTLTERIKKLESKIAHLEFNRTWRKKTLRTSLFLHPEERKQFEDEVKAAEAGLNRLRDELKAAKDEYWSLKFSGRLANVA